MVTNTKKDRKNKRRRNTGNNIKSVNNTPNKSLFGDTFSVFGEQREAKENFASSMLLGEGFADESLGSHVSKHQAKLMERGKHFEALHLGQQYQEDVFYTNRKPEHSEVFYDKTKTLDENLKSIGVEKISQETDDIIYGKKLFNVLDDLKKDNTNAKKLLENSKEGKSKFSPDGTINYTKLVKEFNELGEKNELRKTVDKKIGKTYNYNEYGGKKIFNADVEKLDEFFQVSTKKEVIDNAGKYHNNTLASNQFEAGKQAKGSKTKGINISSGIKTQEGEYNKTITNFAENIENGKGTFFMKREATIKDNNKTVFLNPYMEDKTDLENISIGNRTLRKIKTTKEGEVITFETYQTNLIGNAKEKAKKTKTAYSMGIDSIAKKITEKVFGKGYEGYDYEGYAKSEGAKDTKEYRTKYLESLKTAGNLTDDESKFMVSYLDNGFYNKKTRDNAEIGTLKDTFKLGAGMTWTEESAKPKKISDINLNREVSKFSGKAGKAGIVAGVVGLGMLGFFGYSSIASAKEERRRKEMELASVRAGS